MEDLIGSKAKKFASICLEIGSCPHTVSLLQGRRFQEVSSNFSAHQELYQKRKAICPAIKQDFVMPRGEFMFSVAECEQKAKNWDSATQEWFNGDAPPPRYIREFFDDAEMFFYDCIKPYRCPIIMTSKLPADLEYYRGKPRYFQETFSEIKALCGRD